MKSNISDIIRSHRKSMNLTQEQLAEAVGVTIGAVSKWESGLSSPDIAMLPVLADFFEISIDVLLGYQLTCRTATSASEKIHNLCLQKNYKDGMMEAEKALQRFPNHFEVVYESSVLYHIEGVEENNHSSLYKALQLYETACSLISQNTNPLISESRIHSSIGEVYISLGDIDKAIEHLKKYNSSGLNSAMIGYLLTMVQKYQEAIPYLSDCLLESIVSLFRTTLGLANCYGNDSDFSSALDVLEWFSTTLKGLKYPNSISYIDKALVVVNTSCAQVAASMEDSKLVEHYLKQGITLAKAFDAAPNYSVCNIKYYSGKDMSIGDDFGESALEGMEYHISTYGGDNTLLSAIFRRLMDEE